MRRISVSIVYATREQQWLREVPVTRGSNVAELIEISGFLDEIEDLRGMSLADLQIGIHAQKVALDHLLEEGDRLEIYRPLAADPKVVRRQLALLGKSIGNKSAPDAD